VVEVLEQSDSRISSPFLYGVIERDGVAVGIAPAFLMEFSVVPGRASRAAALRARLGRSRIPGPCSSARLAPTKVTVGLAPGVDRKDALLALQQALRTHARAPGGLAPGMEGLRARHGAGARGLFPWSAFPGTVVEFGSPRKEDYFASLKGCARHILRKKLRRQRRAGPLRTEVIQRPQGEVLMSCSRVRADV